MNVTSEELDEFDEKMEEEYRELFPPRKRRFTFAEVREKYRKIEAELKKKKKSCHITRVVSTN